MNPTAPTTSAQALQSLQGAQASAQDPNSILQAQNSQFGVPQAQQTVTGLRGAINNTSRLLQQVAPSVMGRTGSSLVTNAQATRQIANEQAPISQSLTTQTNDYNQANQDLGAAEQRAQQAASGIYAGQQDKLSYAQNLYNTLYKQEQDAQAEADRQAAAKEAARQFSLLNAPPVTPNATPTTSAGQASMVQRADNGFNFTDQNGNAINAAQYAHLTGQNFRDVLSKAAANGDKGAAQALQFVGNDFGYDPSKVTQQWQADLYKALTGQTAKVKAAPGPSVHDQVVSTTKSAGKGLIGRLESNFNAFAGSKK